ncbi:MAG: RIP metalloprotease RseP [Opitutales bacterium]|nr:RIP metalloprotease RseP [Opitutales bacterium]
MTGEIILRILSNPLAILAVVLFFGASIFFHELGHYLAARWRGLRVDRFSIGFGPRLFGWVDKRGCEWRVAPIPLGGYVMLPQLSDMRGADESTKGHPGGLPQISYADKMYVTGAGAFFNILFALVLGTILWVGGQRVYDSMTTTQIGFVVPTIVDREGSERESPASIAGLRAGDTILALDGQPVREWSDVLTFLTTGSRRTEAGNPLAVLTIERGGEQLDITTFPALSEFEGTRILGLVPATSLIVGQTQDNSPARFAGLQPGDSIRSVDGIPLFHIDPFIRHLEATGGAPVNLQIDRNGQLLDKVLTPEMVTYTTAGATRPMIGVVFERPYEIRHINPFRQISNHVQTTLRVLRALVNPRTNVGLNNLSGPVGIGYTLYYFTQIGIRDLLGIVVLINVNLAILNLLPIPVLDGGHMVFATIAKLRGRALSVNFIATTQSAFVFLFLGVFIYVTFFDVGRVNRQERALIEQERMMQERIAPVFGNREGSDPGEEPVHPEWVPAEP